MTTLPACVVCGHTVQRHTPAYLVSISPETQWLRVQSWERVLAQCVGVRTICQSAHVVEIAALWIATGGLSLEFAQTSTGRPRHGEHLAVARNAEISIPKLRPFVLELSVDRSRVQRALNGDCGSLVRSLDALLDALCRSERRRLPRPLVSGKKQQHSANAVERITPRPSCRLNCVISHPCERLQ